MSYSFDAAAHSTVSVTISLVTTVLILIAYWKIFVKMGEPGWKSIIPIYNNYTLYTKIWNLKWFIITLAVECAVVIAFAFFPIYDFSAPASSVSVVATVALLVLSIFAVVISIIMWSKLSRAFGHGAGFTLGLIFFPVIFLLILAFSSDRYQAG